MNRVLGTEEIATIHQAYLKAIDAFSDATAVRLLSSWLANIGLDPAAYGTHSLRRTKASLIYRRTKNLRAVQLLLGHTKLESTVRYLGSEVDDALEIAEQRDRRLETRWRMPHFCPSPPCANVLYRAFARESANASN